MDADICEHLRLCPGCELCFYWMQFFTACDGCGQWGHMDSDGWVRENKNAEASRVFCMACGDRANVVCN